MSNCHYAANKLAKVLSRIQNACDKYDRSGSDIRLVGASKKQTPLRIREFANEGLQDIGENYLQEAMQKRRELADLAIHWHYIGQIQSNKTRQIAAHFSWVHGVDRFKIAQRLAAQNPNPEPLNLLIQINADAETSKAGVNYGDAPELCAQVAELNGIRLRGFMLIPKPRTTLDAQRAVFAKAKHLLDSTNQSYGLQLDQLSMGMSSDLEAAIAEGSTMVRVGTDLFGPRD